MSEAYTECMQHALQRVARRKHSVHELRVLLQKKAFESAIVEEVIARLIDMEYLNDTLFAKAYAHDSMSFQRKGPFIVRKKLQEKGVDHAHIESALTKYQHIAESSAQQIALSKIERFKERYDHEAHLYLKRFLVRRGFSSHQATKAVEYASNVTPPTCE